MNGIEDIKGKLKTLFSVSASTSTRFDDINSTKQCLFTELSKKIRAL